ncbi:DMT family transporter [Bacillus pinisoli]|uniref:DMT family transporter n=1 Tax=Bacillus pinisoli TaxID=2901866 RepID=UPI001FF13651|nr:DMT family transporter [Bacillus pinisoli]
MNPLLYGLLVILTTFLMGSSFAVGKIGLEYVSPLLLVGIRFTIAGTIMSLFLWNKHLPQNSRDWFKIVLIGSLQTAGVMGCIFLSLRTITAGESSILTFTNPLLVVILGTALLGIRYHFLQWIGVIVGFVGVFITLGFSLKLEIGTFFGLGSAVSWAAATILIKKWGNRFNTWVLTAYQMLFGGLLLLIMSVILEDIYITINSKSILIIVWLAVMASIVQFTIWFYLLKEGDPAKTSAFLFLAPFFGVLTGWLILGEEIRWNVFLGGTLIFIGIFLVNWFLSSIEEKAKKKALF